MNRTTTPILAALCLCIPAASLALNLPSVAQRAAVEVEDHGSERLPITGWQHGGVQSIWAEGAILREAWHLPASGKTTLQILAPLREQLVADGYDVLFECETADCGGFDFRYELRTLKEPDMHVDLGDFRYLAASRAGTQSPEYVSLLVSRAAGRGFLQVTRIGAPIPVEAAAISSRGQAAPDVNGFSPTALADPVSELERIGRAVLNDLQFARGSSQLVEGEVPSIVAIADWLRSNPDAEIVLVGHTDAVGGLAANIRLSKARASAVRARLTGRHGIAGARVAAEGVGYLVPVAPNDTDAGRTMNRRVEVVRSDPG